SERGALPLHAERRVGEGLDGLRRTAQRDVRDRRPAEGVERQLTRLALEHRRRLAASDTHRWAVRSDEEDAHGGSSEQESARAGEAPPEELLQVVGELARLPRRLSAPYVLVMDEELGRVELSVH